MRVVKDQDVVSDIVNESLGIPTEEVKIDEVSQLEVVRYIDDCWSDARSAKEESVEAQIISNIRQTEGKYDSIKLADIKAIGGSEVFVMITDAKVKNAINWVEELLLQPGQRPWDLSPTPVPELPQDMMQALAEELISDIMGEITAASPLSGPMVTPGKMDINMINDKLMDVLPRAQEMLKEKTYQRAKELSEKISKEVDDKLVEGGWYSAVRECLPNIINHTGFITGPILKKRPVVKVYPLQNGKLVSEVVNEVIPTYTSVSSLNMYPAPDSTGINDGYLFERMKLTPIEIQNMIGVGSYNEDEIRAVLQEIEDGVLKSEWLTVDEEIATLGGSISPIFYDSSKVDCLKFSGAIKGKMIKEWGQDKDPEGEKIDEDFWYNVFIYKIGTHIISIQYNNDPLGEKPYYKDSFENRDGSFWGRGLPEIIYDAQTVCNAVARAIVNNASMASGPQVERNVDRIPAASRGDNTLIPWKVWDSTNDMMQTGHAFQFYQPTLVSNQLLEVYKHFSRVADEHSGIPAFAHGDTQVGGAGNTASGLSMLMGSAARGIKALIKSIDENIIKPSVKKQYLWLIEREDYFGMICDYRVVSGGSMAALNREQMVSRRLEFMNNTANPVDAQIMGMEGRKYVIDETAKALGLDLARFMPKRMPEQAPQPMQFAPPGANSQQLDQAGNPVVGQDTRMFNIPAGG